MPEFLRFCIVGVIGFCTDYGVLELAVMSGLIVALARALSLIVAMHVTYILNGSFTYRDHHGFTRRSWAQYMVTNLTGACVNYVVFMLVLTYIDSVDASINRLVAIVCGTGIALWFNYWANRRFAFRKRPHE
jgi:putative flippase GtrA